MTEITRRQLLTFLGAATAAAALPSPLGHLAHAGSLGDDLAGGHFTPVRVPHPLPIYTKKKSWLATGPGAGSILPVVTDPALPSYTVVDDVVLSPEYTWYAIARWGDRIFADGNDYVGYNCDYTAFIRLDGKQNDGLLWVNHEYCSFPFSPLAPEAPASLAASPTSFAPVIGFALPAVLNREVMGEILYNCGGTIARIKKNGGGKFQVVPGDPLNRRVHGLSGLATNALRTDGYQGVTAWGARPHQQGDGDYLVGTGPAAVDVFPLSTDGLFEKIVGTAFNCSGGTTPWHTVLSAEENFQGTPGTFYVGVTEDVKPNGTQTGYLAGTTGAEFGQVGEKYGWMVEIDPTGEVRGRKHTALGRFRHENIAMRVKGGSPLVAYLGDDRRGGHVYKYVSHERVGQLADPGNSALLEDGVLHVARFNPDGTGEWIPLVRTTPTNPIAPTDLASEEVAALGTSVRKGRTRLPRRNGVAGQAIDGGLLIVDTDNEATVLPAYAGKTLGDFYPTQGAVLCDAYLASNLAGGTPSARPEDIEINPRNAREVLIAMTDGAPGSDGYPDSRVFVVAKYSTALDETQQSGSLHKIIEDGASGTGLTFRWERFVQAGEAGAADGLGLGAIDNLTFDAKGNLWGVTDMSTPLHNGFGTGAAPAQTTINHALAGDTANLVGVFGNNMLFCIPLAGKWAGWLLPVGYGPVRSEMTGPTFIGDTLVLAVQHPGEDVPIGDGTLLHRSIEMLKLDGTTFLQSRTVPRGSNWPDNATADPANVPRPTVIGICRKR